MLNSRSVLTSLVGWLGWLSIDDEWPNLRRASQPFHRQGIPQHITARASANLNRLSPCLHVRSRDVRGTTIPLPRDASFLIGKRVLRMSSWEGGLARSRCLRSFLPCNCHAAESCFINRSDSCHVLNSLRRTTWRRQLIRLAMS